MTRLVRMCPDLVAHRGASGYRPEHTTAAYRLAIALGADGIELDLVATKDGVLVARHEPELSRTTDVATRTEFADRKTTKLVDGRSVSGWFVNDLTLAELKTLRATERMADIRPDNMRFDGQFAVPTLAEVLTLVEDESHRLGRTVQVYLELKHATWFAGVGLPLDTLLVETLRECATTAPVKVLAFETAILRQLRSVLDAPLVQLIEAGGTPYDRAIVGDIVSYRDMVTPRGLMRIADYAHGIGVAKNLILPRGSDGAATTPSCVVSDAHALGLEVAIWTLRDENDFMAANFRHGTNPSARGGAVAEYKAFLAAGVDVIIGDHPDTALEARRMWLRERSPLPV
ncbi:MAG TPA: glycerophosphodiester phosphodiesterase family protein [Nocardioidaceae bacterium]|nr:glycerophosphodiester phosphodiesterase family protein [Nocardioidaceae bacterium]